MELVGTTNKIAFKLRLKAGLYINYIVHGVGLIILAQTMTNLTGLWQVSLTNVAYVLSALGTGKIFSYLILGELSDRFARKRILQFGMFAYFIFFLGIPLTQNVWQAYFITIFAGLANSALDTVTYATLSELSNGQASSNILVKAMMSIGEGLLPLLVSYLAIHQIWFGWSYWLTLIILSLNGLNIGTLAPKQFYIEHEKLKQGTVRQRLGRKDWLQAIPYCLFGFTAMWLMIHFTQWITVFGQSVRQLSAVSAHLLMSSYSLGSLCGVTVIYILSKTSWFKDSTLLILATSGALIALVSVWVTTNVFLMNSMSFLFGMTAAGGMLQLGLNLFLNQFSATKGRVTGIYFFGSSLAAFLMPIITGKLVMIGLSQTLGSDIIIAVLNLGLAFIIYKQANTFKI
ncbi:MFS transporter [Periweissella beninensis]|uniref:MFS transporter n=1 Tax=Periweissella beninensis TaxID=504936 RepID=A0ABT0VGA9_9LACO|nr:MFS transporter [Periweissella beninensis]MBM7543758.1 MFS family permease [Periweissella beninensis]MCM2436858.1 MFS transporter [Periweissella beninensis]MCT4396452.1 MFS transporter [Periweissella beninensis]